MTTTALAADKQQERGQIFIASTSRCHFGVLGWTASFFLQLSPVKIIAQIAQLTVGSLSLSLWFVFISAKLLSYHYSWRHTNPATTSRLRDAIEVAGSCWCRHAHTHKQLTVTDFCHRRINYVTYFDKLRLSLLQFLFLICSIAITLLSADVT